MPERDLGADSVLRVAITGSSGLIGSHLIRHLRARGHSVAPLKRGQGAPSWDPADGRIEWGAEPCDAIVHLAGAGIADRRWSAARKLELWQSRVDATRRLCAALSARHDRPRVLLCASGISFYGDRGDAVLSEVDAPGRGFLADLCQAWEGACEPARAAGIRVITARFAVVLSRHGGALPRMLRPFRVGLGGRLGSGRQYFSWVGLEDALRAVTYALTSEVSGPLNIAAPQPLPQIDFARVLACILHRPLLGRVPAPLLRLAVGELAGELLASIRAMPERLLAAGFSFVDPDLEKALRSQLADSDEHREARA
jgi:uncharacterized protein